MCIKLNESVFRTYPTTVSPQQATSRLDERLTPYEFMLFTEVEKWVSINVYPRISPPRYLFNSSLVDAWK